MSGVKMGLNPAAQKMVAGVEKVVGKKVTIVIYDDGRKQKILKTEPYGESNVKKEEAGKYSLDGQEYPLYRYIFPEDRGGGVLVEDVQYRGKCNLGKVVYLALRDSMGVFVPETLWDLNDIKSLSFSHDGEELADKDHGVPT